MAVRTYIPQILAFAKWLKKYVNDHSETLRRYMGDGLYALITLLVDLVIVVASIVEAGHAAGDAWDTFSPVSTLNSTELNSIDGAIQKFYATIGVTPGS